MTIGNVVPAVHSRVAAPSIAVTIYGALHEHQLDRVHAAITIVIAALPSAAVISVISVGIFEGQYSRQCSSQNIIEGTPITVAAASAETVVIHPWLIAGI